ncbi:LLM class flavin-dependent oxidoreductase [Paracraurococcus lichenis]|uniref:LLM class flavin-dependent oxidoreductase n=1 Tax=Paracraurococcus lichenis TaxID=3064888 RepID=A0ABT9E1Q0_9PROT|nr:LLM class flavin-dependent oxidoreductase [Paracraurococcus sp. LOR1-02]MDO9710092.1 LLM class flavin-dependent oxidoreductase [Paracraurococcus sp. LOR1-02]
MKFMLFVLPTIPGTLEDRQRLRPIGRNNERFQAMLDEVRKLAVFADDAGFDVMATTEHHFHSEGYEASVAPLMLYTDLAARTKRIRFSPLGLVLPSWDPLRCAEEIAYLDHLTQGRIYAGFARGYQDRWVNVLGQHYHVTAAPMDGGAIDQHNRKVYEEVLSIMKKAWTQDSITHDGEYYKIPFPPEGITRWPVGPWTREYGAPGEVDEKGVVKRICVIPKPYQQPHPRLFQPFSVSENTIRYTAQSDITPWILVADPPQFERLCRIYQDVAAGAGRSLRLGESVGAFRAVHFGATEDEAVALLRDTNYAGFKHYFGGFGFWEAMRTAEDEARWPLAKGTMLPESEWTVDRMRRCKYALAGTVDQVKREIEALHKVGGSGELEWFGWFFDQGFMPLDQAMRQLELFARHIIPEFR